MLNDHLNKIPDEILFENYVLDNGLTVVLVPIKNVFSVDAKLTVRVGSQYETKNTSGLSHFLEHMNFKGTKNKPDHLSLTKDIENYGGITNASTGYEFTSYYTHVGFEHLDTALEFLSEQLTNSIFPEKEFEKEKGVIIEEIRMYEDMPRAKAEDLFLSALYGDQPSGWNIAGTEKNIVNMKRDTMVEYYKKHYLPSNAFLVISGNFKNTLAKKLVSQFFGTSAKPKKISYPKTAITKKPFDINWCKKDVKEHNFVLGCHSYKMGDPKNYTLSIINAILSSGFNSRLYLNVREKLGGAYYIYSSLDAMSDRGIFGIYGGINNDKSLIIMEEIIKELRKLKEELVSKEELEKVKNRYISMFLMSLDNPYKIKSPIESWIAYPRKFVSPKQEIEKILKISPKDILKISQELFVPNNFKMGVLSPTLDRKALSKIVNKL